MTNNWKLPLLGMLLGLAGVASAAQPVLAIMQPRAAASPPGVTTGAVYLMVHNTGAVADRLIGASSPAAKRVEIHATQIQDGVARMRPVSGLDIPVGGSIEFSAGGSHLMLVDLVKPLVAGEKLQLTLRFSRSGELKTTVPVGSLVPAQHQAH